MALRKAATASSTLFWPSRARPRFRWAEADLGWIVGWKKESFLGSDVLKAQKARGPAKKLAGFEMLDRAIARHGYDAYVDYYNQAVRNYYSQQSQPAPPEQTQRAGYGQAHGDARASSRAQRTQRPSQQGDYADLDYSGSRSTAPLHETSAPGPTGLPNFGQAGARADQPLREADESTQPSSPA